MRPPSNAREGLFDGDDQMKRLVIVAEMPDNYAAALEYGPGRIDEWAERAFGTSLECDFDGTQWAKDVERLFGVKWDGCRDAFNVVEARLEDAEGEMKKRVEVSLDSRTAALLEELAKLEGVTPRTYLTRALVSLAEKEGAEAH